MRTGKSTDSIDQIGSGEKLDIVHYVNDNYDEYEDRWGLNLMNLEEVTGEEMTDENMANILPKLLCEADNKKRIMMIKKMENRKKLMQTMKKEEKEWCREELNEKKQSVTETLVFIYVPFHYRCSS